MILSNSPKPLALTFLLMIALQACGGSPSHEPVSNAPISQQAAEFPFSTREPEVFLGNFVVIADGLEKRWFLARDRDKWRLDVYDGAELYMSQIKTDKLYAVDHRTRRFSEYPSTADAPDPDILLSGFFRGKVYHHIDDAGSDGPIRKYAVRVDEGSRDEIIISIDERHGMIIRQEFFEGSGEGKRLSVTYEARDLRMEVEESVIAIPAGYRQVAYELLYQTIPKASKQ